jgi:hypothetical protein
MPRSRPRRKRPPPKRPLPNAPLACSSIANAKPNGPSTHLRRVLHCYPMLMLDNTRRLAPKQNDGERPNIRTSWDGGRKLIDTLAAAVVGGGEESSSDDDGEALPPPRDADDRVTLDSVRSPRSRALLSFYSPFTFVLLTPCAE